MVDNPADSTQENGLFNGRLDTIINDDIKHMPDANEQVIEREAGKIDTINDTIKDNGSINDSVKENIDTSPVFDPAIHCTNDDGTPRLTKTGKFRLRKGVKSGTIRPTDVKRTENMTILASTITKNEFAILAGIFGDDLAARVHRDKDGNLLIDEEIYLTNAWRDYLLTTPLNEVPGWIGLLIAHTIFIPKFMQEKPKSKIVSGFNWIVSKVKGWF